MRLYYSPTSPYARKVRVLGRMAGLQWQMVHPDLLDAQSDYGTINPIHRIPSLVLDETTVLYDSRVIAEYLDTTYGLALVPVSGPARWAVLKLQALGDGLMEVAVPRRMEEARPPERQSRERIGQYDRSMRQVLDALETQVDALEGVSLGTISIACALAYVSFRFPGLDWAQGRPRLAQWHTDFETHPFMTATRYPA